MLLLLSPLGSSPDTVGGVNAGLMDALTRNNQRRNCRFAVLDFWPLCAT